MTKQPQKPAGKRKRARTYESPLRLEQAGLTRQRIIEAYGDEIVGGGDRDITLRQVAKRAGVSVPTLYRNFTSVDELGAAYWSWLQPKIASFESIESADDLPGFTEGVFARFAEFEPQMQALFLTRAGRRMRERSVSRRNEVFQKVLAPLTKGMPEREALGVIAVCKVLSSGHVWHLLRNDWGLDDKEAGRASAWAIRALVNTLRQTSKRPLTPKTK